jgi:ribosome maturation factor RimP
VTTSALERLQARLEKAKLAAIEKIIEECVAGLGYELVDVEFVGGGLLRISIDLKDSDPRALLPIADATIKRVSIEDCEAVNRQLGHVLMVEDYDYQRLEIASPGLDRPLRKEADFRRFEGFTVALKLRTAFKGRKNFEGVLSAEAEGKFAVELGAVPLHGIKGAQQVKAELNSGGKARRGVLVTKPSGKPLSKTALKKAAALEAKQLMLASRALAVAGRGSGKSDTEELVTKLVFSLDEVEKVKLVPVV